WTLRLRGGHEFRRQLASFAAIASGDAVRGQLDLYPKDSAIMCKMVAWLPRRVPAAGLSGTLHVRTMPDSLLRARIIRPSLQLGGMLGAPPPDVVAIADGPPGHALLLRSDATAETIRCQ